jgi:hypothetical protein
MMSDSVFEGSEGEMACEKCGHPMKPRSEDLTDERSFTTLPAGKNTALAETC